MKKTNFPDWHLSALTLWLHLLIISPSMLHILILIYVSVKFCHKKSLGENILICYNRSMLFLILNSTLYIMFMFVFITSNNLRHSSVWDQLDWKLKMRLKGKRGRSEGRFILINISSTLFLHDDTNPFEIYFIIITIIISIVVIKIRFWLSVEIVTFLVFFKYFFNLIFYET